MDHARGLALRLHALHAVDRAWLLAHIDEASRQQLLDLLTEISEIGLQPDAALLAFASSGSTNTSAVEAEIAMRIDMANAATARAVLEQEPQSVRRCLRDLRAWSWRDGLDAGFSGQRNEPSVAAMETALSLRLTPRTRAALLQAFASALDLARERPLAPVASASRNKLGVRNVFATLRSRLMRQ